MQQISNATDIFSPESASSKIMAVHNYQSRAVQNQSNVTVFTEHQTEYDISNYYDYYDYGDYGDYSAWDYSLLYPEEITANKINLVSSNN